MIPSLMAPQLVDAILRRFAQDHREFDPTWTRQVLVDVYGNEFEKLCRLGPGSYSRSDKVLEAVATDLDRAEIHPTYVHLLDDQRHPRFRPDEQHGGNYTIRNQPSRGRYGSNAPRLNTPLGSCIMCFEVLNPDGSCVRECAVSTNSEN
jgi:hypothetical protein